MSEPRRFARFYYPEFKRDYPDIYADDRAFATWMRLLTVAEDSWPASPELPRSVRAAALRTLTDRGLVTVTGDHFELRGFTAERGKREQSARNAAAVRWQSASNAAAPASAMPKRVRREDEESTDDARDPEWLRAWFAIGRTRMPTVGQQAVIDAYLRAFDLTGDPRLAQQFLAHPDDPIGAAKEDLSAARAAWAEAAAAQDKPKPIQRRGSGLPTSTRELIEHWRQSAQPEDAA